MRRLICESVLLVGACMLASTAGGAQQKDSAVAYQPVSADLAVTFSLEKADIVPTQCCFWMKGGGADAAITFWKGLGITASVTGDQISNYSSGYDVNKIAILAGPRYTRSLGASSANGGYRHRFQVYGDGLAGEVHAFNGTFPSSADLKSTASSFALQTGGGVNMYFSNNFGVRLIEADYVRTLLPNGSANVQNDLRLAFGVTYHIGHAPRP
jgi:hypothetical protein